ncbi:MAG: protein kinase [Tepidisphaeraceae bacterium]|jgi:hypothetical protein
MQQDVSGQQTRPEMLGAYCIQRTLVEGKSWLAQAAGGRRVVLKSLPDECLAGGQLHADIRDRLERIRELAHVGVANLYGVERDGPLTFAVWEYVEGRTLAHYLQQPRGLAVRRVAHEIVSSVQSLHLLGLSHGALHERNVIVTPTGAIRLTHLSPLLYLDPDVDVQGLLDVLPLLGCRDELADLDCTAPMRELSLRVLAWSKDSRCASTPQMHHEDASRWNQRRASLLGAAIAAAVAIGVAAFAIWHAGQASSAVQPAPAPAGSNEQTPPPAEPSAAIDGMLAHKSGGRP